MTEPDIGPRESRTDDAGSGRAITPRGYERWLVPAVVLAMLAIAGLWRTQHAGVDALDRPTMVETWGVRPAMVAVTAAGGLLDLRLEVVDPEKAKLLVGDEANTPVLIVDGPGTRLAAAQPIQASSDVVRGTTWFLLYGNAGGAVRTGSRVSVAIGDARPETVIAR